MTDLATLNKFKCMLDNLQSQINIMSQELNRTIQSVQEQKQPTSNQLEIAVQGLFKIRQIPNPTSYDKETCEATIKTFADRNKWRPETCNKIIKQLHSIFNKQSGETISKSQLKKIEKNKMTVQELNENKLRAKFLKFGVRIGNDFRKEVLLQLVHQKATELKWRNNTLAKNLVIINKVLERSPLVKSASSYNWFAEMDASRIKPNEVPNESDSDDSFIDYMSSALENMSKVKESNKIFLEQSDAFNE